MRKGQQKEPNTGLKKLGTTLGFCGQRARSMRPYECKDQIICIGRKKKR